MHELSMVEGILKAALGEAEKSGGKRIKSIFARIRESGHPMEAAPLESLMETLAKGTAAEGAEIKIEVITPTIRCKDCKATFNARGGTLLCPHCQSSRLEELDAEQVDLECSLAE